MLPQGRVPILHNKLNFKNQYIDLKIYIHIWYIKPDRKVLVIIYPAKCYLAVSSVVYMGIWTHIAQEKAECHLKKNFIHLFIWPHHMVLWDADSPNQGLNLSPRLWLWSKDACDRTFFRYLN